MSPEPSRPPGALPAHLVNLEPDSWTQPFWAAAREHRLVALRCTGCATFRMPPTPFCPACRSQQIEWVTLSGRGRVYTYSVVRHPPTEELADYVPYVLALIEFDDAPGIRLMTNVVDTDPDLVRSGQLVEVMWDDVDESTTVPRFRPL